jgi:hypothetical protein
LFKKPRWLRGFFCSKNQRPAQPVRKHKLLPSPSGVQSDFL